MNRDGRTFCRSREIIKTKFVIIITYQLLIYDRLWREPTKRTCFQVASPGIKVKFKGNANYSWRNPVKRQKKNFPKRQSRARIKAIKNFLRNDLKRPLCNWGKLFLEYIVGHWRAWDSTFLSSGGSRNRGLALFQVFQLRLLGSILEFLNK